MVAEWPFCPECFDDLLKGKAREKAAGSQGPSPVQSEVEAGAEEIPAVPQPEKPKCQMCRRDLEPGEGKKVGIWNFCPECYRDLIPPPVPEAPEEEGLVMQGPEGAQPGVPGEEEAPGGIGRVLIGLVSRVKCRGCGRSIPEGGSRLVDGEPYCPDCYYALPVREGAEVSTSDSEASPREDVPAKGTPPPQMEGALERCASCAKPLRPGAYEEIEGFSICRACLSTDRDLAIQLARSRHRKNLERLRDDLA